MSTVGGATDPRAVDARDAALHALFDDASTFPPRRLGVEAALAAHVAIRTGTHARVLNRFMVAGDQAPQLAAAVAAGYAADLDPLEVGIVLPRSGVGSISPVVRVDLAALQPLADQPRVRITGLEMSLTGPDPLADVPGVVAGLATVGLPDQIVLTCEIALAGRPAGEVVRRINRIADVRDDGVPLLVKLRVVGQRAGTGPSDVELAGFLRACADARVPVKLSMGSARAGRARHPATGEVEHGVLNLLGAAILAHRGADLGTIRAAVVQPIEEIRLGPGALIVGAEVLDSDVVQDARRELLRSINCADLAATNRELASMGVLAGSPDPAPA